MLRCWRRLLLSSLTVAFHPLHDTSGTALQIVASAAEQQDERAVHQLAALLRLLVHDKETMLFRVSGWTEGCCLCQWPISHVYALHVAHDMSACWLLPHLVAEQSVICAEVQDEGWSCEVSSAAETAETALSIRRALLRLPLPAGPLNSVQHSSGWTECVSSILDTATLVTRTATHQHGCRDRQQVNDSDQLAQHAAHSHSLSRNAADGKQAEAAGKREEKEDGAEVCRHTSQRASDKSGAALHRAEESRGRVKARAHEQYEQRQESSERDTATPATPELSRGDTAEANKKSDRRGRNSSSGRRGRGRGKHDGGRDKPSEDGDCDSADDEWSLATTNPQLDAEIALLVTLRSGRRGSLRLHNKREAQREEAERAARKIELIEHLAAERFRERIAAQQHRHSDGAADGSTAERVEQRVRDQRAVQLDEMVNEAAEMEQVDEAMTDELKAGALSPQCALPTPSPPTQQQMADGHSDSTAQTPTPHMPALEPETAQSQL